MTSYTFTIINEPNVNSSGGYTNAQGISNAGTIAGDYLDGNFNVDGFTLSGGTFGSLSDPAVPGQTYATGINASGEVTGLIQPSSGAGAGGQVGFLYQNGTYTTLIDPQAWDGYQTNPQGINDSSQIVGWFALANADAGFLYSGGQWTTITAPGATGTFAEGINNKGQIVGYYESSSGGWNGFLYSNGAFQTLNDPLGTYGTFPHGINDSGEIVGTYQTASGNFGFLYSNGVFTTIQVTDPTLIAQDAQITGLSGINNAGEMVGSITSGTGAVLVTPTGPVVTNTSGEQATLTAPVANTAVEGGGYDILNLSTNPIASASSAYTITSNHDGSFTLATAGSSDHVSGVMQIQFSNETVTIAANGSESEYIALLYQGALGRIPDAPGLAYWEQIAASLPASTQALGVYGLSDASGNYNGTLSIAGGFTNSAEFIAKYGSLSNAQFVTQLYANVLDRAPDTSGFNYWMSELNSGTSREHVLVGFADSAEAINNATLGYAGQSGAHAAWLTLI